MYSEHYDFAVSLTPCKWDQYMLLIDAWLYILRKFRSKSFIQMKPICHLQSSISSFFSIVLIHSRFMSYYVALFLGFHISSSTFVIVYAPWFVFFFSLSLSFFVSSVLSSYSNRVRNFPNHTQPALLRVLDSVSNWMVTSTLSSQCQVILHSSFVFSTPCFITYWLF